MPRAPATKPRKSASQERSRLTVDALLEATARVLVKEGYDRASTNRIAVTAGVSVGSLYQYFPSKESLVAALVARHNREMLDVLREAVAQVAGQPVEVVVRELVRATIEAHQVDPALHRIFAEQVPRMGQLAEIEGLQRDTAELFRGFLEENRARVGISDLDTATFICVSTVETLAHGFVIRRPRASAREQDAFIDEVTRLIVGYVAARSPRAASAAPVVARQTARSASEPRPGSRPASEPRRARRPRGTPG